MWGEIMGAAAGGIGSILNYLDNERNIKFQKWANEQNIKLVRETNAQNMAIFERSLQQNDPVYQRSRMEAAGFNPLNMTNAIGSNMRVSPISLDSPSVQAPHSDQHATMQAMFDGILSLAQLRKLNAETDSVEIANSQAADKFKADLDNKIASTESLKAGAIATAENIKAKWEELRLRKVSVDSEVALQTASIHSMAFSDANKEQQTKLLKLDESLKQIQLKYAGKLADAQLRSYNADIKKVYAQIDLIKQQTTNADVKSSLAGLELLLATKTFDSSVELMESKARNETYFKPATQTINSISNLVKAFK